MKRYIYSCRRIVPAKRDVAQAYQIEPEELNPNAPVGEIAQNAVTLSEEGVEAYRRASNLLSIEEEVEAFVQGEVVERDVEDASVAGVGSIPEDADLTFLQALAMREKQGEKAGRGVKIAVLDQGLGSVVASWLHSAGILAGAWSMIGERATDAKGDHGTHVATTATPDGAKLYHYQVLADHGSGSSSGIIRAIYHAVEQGVDLINMSLGGSGGGEGYETAIRYARSRGVLVFCAAGNTGRQEHHYPASCPSAISVAAYDRASGAKASFSTFNTAVDLAGSGVGVLAYLASGALGRMNGTSMATPTAVFVAVLVAGMTGARGDALLQALRSAAKDMPGPATWDGNGLVQGKRTVRKIRGKE
ncbi:S8 family peptidase [Rubrobacter indicoceani]|uniref:S8 family peptidase n=1 Tax=Rubrobacter indicoceani TaxID=2051957 RepID=UPI000E5B967F|nr:S8 family serine peptidase [Rubrobacter indicoceani]